MLGIKGIAANGGRCVPRLTKASLLNADRLRGTDPDALGVTTSAIAKRLRRKRI